MTVTTLANPTPRDALAELDAAFERGEMISIFGRCTVEYAGRAASSLGPGDRLVILKPDGAALVHTDEQRTPVNWQPPGCDHSASVRDGRLRIRSRRTNPEETLDVDFERVEQLSAYAVTDRSDLDLRGSEEDLREYVLSHPDLIADGFEPTETERQSAAGAMDIFGHDADGMPVVVELKRRRVGPSAVSQLRRYVDAVRRELGAEVPNGAAARDGEDGEVDDDREVDDDGEIDDEAAVRGVLVAPSVTDRAADLLAAEEFEFVAVDPDA
ncbi:MAG: endonuclease NucS [Salinigranum sp.]